MKRYLLLFLLGLSITCANAQSIHISSVQKQAVYSGAGGGTAGGTAIYSSAACFGSNANCASVIPISGIFKNLNVSGAVAPGAGQSYQFTIEIFSTFGTPADSLVTCTVSGTAKTCNDATDSAQITAGQYWSIKLVTSATAASTGAWTASFEFDPQ